MVLITLAKNPIDCRVEIDRIDISSRLCRIEVDAAIGARQTCVRLTVVDDVAIVGEAGRIEFIKQPRKG